MVLASRRRRSPGSPSNRWSANAPLAPAHPQTVICSFQNVGLRVTNRIVWKPTDLLTAGGDLDSDAALKNDVLNALRFQLQPPAGLTDLLVGVYRDREQDIVMRDYAVQHLVSWYEQLPETETGARELIQRVFQEALAETASSIAGTALLGLHNLSAAYPEFNTPELAATALRLARNEAASELVRITALQVCAARGIKDALPAALALANAAPTIPVQISAIAALGALGGADHRSFLEELADGPEPRLQPAARTALNRLQTRLAQAKTQPARN